MDSAVRRFLPDEDQGRYWSRLIVGGISLVVVRRRPVGFSPLGGIAYPHRIPLVDAMLRFSEE